MSWLRRLSSSKSTWAKLHKSETKPNTFNPMSTNWSKIEIAKNMMSNLVWKEIYDSLLSCRTNLLMSNPLEFFTLPVNEDPYITKNNDEIQQPRCVNLIINDILNVDGNLKKIVEKGLFFMKILLLKMLLESLLKAVNTSVARHV